jgi:uncharacterized protein (TIGR03790 family)
MKKLAMSGVLILVLGGVASALGPHEIAVVANGDSADSLEVAQNYCRLRDVPETNLVELDMPEGIGGGNRRISPEAFRQHILAPVQKALEKRQIGGHVLAWVYSVDFPTVIGTQPPMSLQGITFTRGKVPPEMKIKSGGYVSALFAGPKNLESKGHISRTLDVQRNWLGSSLPLPSMHLGYTGRFGNDKKTVLECLARGKKADHSFPRGTVFLVKQEDVRSRCREWQFPGAVKELEELGVEARIVDNFPDKAEKVIGIMIGSAHVDPARIDEYLPGCMAEHLTSSAGVFSGPGQTKLTEWISAGATASAGTVTEPYAIWTKFPAARFYVHYASGCSIIESFYQSIRAPLQIMLVGDPLSAPWAADGSIKVEGLGEGRLRGTVDLSCEAADSEGSFYSKYVYLLDGVPVGKGKNFKLDTRGVEDGSHRLRIVAYSSGLLKNQLYTNVVVEVLNDG